MKHLSKLTYSFLITLSFILYACDKDDDNSINNEPESPDVSGLTLPEYKKNMTTTDYDGVSFKVRFTNGGDVYDNMSCVVHWATYSEKQSTTPSKSDMRYLESMDPYPIARSSTVFDKAHAGISGGTYIYYYFECENSKGPTASNVTYTITKR